MRTTFLRVHLALVLASTPVAIVAIGEPIEPNLSRRDCASSHGDYGDSQYWDPGLVCTTSLTGQDYSVVSTIISQMFVPCGDEAGWLNQASIWEWTGNYETEYWWDGWQLGNSVGIHWDYVSDFWLLAHEGAHGAWGASESQARDRADECLYALSQPAAFPAR